MCSGVFLDPFSENGQTLYKTLTYDTMYIYVQELCVLLTVSSKQDDQSGKSMFLGHAICLP